MDDLTDQLGFPYSLSLPSVKPSILTQTEACDVLEHLELVGWLLGCYEFVLHAVEALDELEHDGGDFDNFVKAELKRVYHVACHEFIVKLNSYWSESFTNHLIQLYQRLFHHHCLSQACLE